VISVDEAIAFTIEAAETEYKDKTERDNETTIAQQSKRDTALTKNVKREKKHL